MRPCRKANCPRLTEGGYCDQHQQDAPRQQFDRRRGSAWSRGYDDAWTVLRRQALRRDMYLCQHCKKEGRQVPATDVDHIDPFDGKHDPRRLDLSNLQSLCKPCHSRKTATEDSSFARRSNNP